MAKIINMPRLGLTMEEGVISKWVKTEGDTVEKGDILAEIESDKSVVPFESPEAGTILKLLADELDTIEIYKPIAVIGEAGESIDDLGLTGAGGEISEDENSNEEQDNADDTDTSETAGRVFAEGEKVFASPSAKRVARENNINIGEVPLREGKERITKDDVLEYAENNHVRITPTAKKVAEDMGVELKEISQGAAKRIYRIDVINGMTVKDPALHSNEDTVIPVTGMRKVIAHRMKESQEIAAHLTTVIDVDMTKIMELRKSVMDIIAEKYGVKLSYNDVILKCVAAAIEEYPRVNCTFTEKEITVKGDINLGMAVANGEGLVVPVIRNANYLSLGDIAYESKRLANKAKDTGLAPDDMQGGTFTVSNLGMYGITSFTSIINQPESAILSVGGTVNKPVVTEEGEIVVRPMMTLTISYDHRAMDGSMSAIFLKKLKDIMENPYTLIV